MFWGKKPVKDMNSEIARAMDAGVNAFGAFNTYGPVFRWADKNESPERRIAKLVALAVEIRQECRKYLTFYPKGAAGTFAELLDNFLADEQFKQDAVQEAENREVEVARSKAMVEAVRAGQDRSEGFLRLVEATTLHDIQVAKSLLTTTNKTARGRVHLTPPAGAVALPSAVENR